MDERIVIAPYDPSWPQRFNDEARAVREALGAAALTVHHIGSTAVPGCAAKPIVDMQVSIRSLEEIEPLFPALAALGYVWFPYPDEPERYFFRRPTERPRRVHLHVCADGSDWQYRHLLFREYLRAHADAVERYAAEKMRLAQRFPSHGRMEYTDAKSPMIAALLGEASEWAARTSWRVPPSDA